ncbi:hypothetical protein [Salinarchaeum chitinilyticum]
MVWTMDRSERRERSVSDDEYERMPGRIEAAFDRVRDLLPDSERDE